MTTWTDPIKGIIPVNWTDYRITWTHDFVDETDLHAFIKSGEASPTMQDVKTRIIRPGYGISEPMFRPRCPMDPFGQDWWIWYQNESDAEAARNHPDDVVHHADLVYVVGMIHVGDRIVYIGTENERS